MDNFTNSQIEILHYKVQSDGRKGHPDWSVTSQNLCICFEVWLITLKLLSISSLMHRSSLMNSGLSLFLSLAGPCFSRIYLLVLWLLKKSAALRLKFFLGAFFCMYANRLFSSYLPHSPSRIQFARRAFGTLWFRWRMLYSTLCSVGLLTKKVSQTMRYKKRAKNDDDDREGGKKVHYIPIDMIGQKCNESSSVIAVIKRSFKGLPFKGWYVL